MAEHVVVDLYVRKRDIAGVSHDESERYPAYPVSADYEPRCGVRIQPINQLLNVYCRCDAKIVCIIRVGVRVLIVEVANYICHIHMLASYSCYSNDIALVGCTYSQGGRYTGEREIGVVDHYPGQGYVAVIGDYDLELDCTGHHGLRAWGRVRIMPCHAAIYGNQLLDIDFDPGNAPVMCIIRVGIGQLTVVAYDIGQVLVLAYHRCYRQDIAFVPFAYAQARRYTGEREVGVIDYYACQSNIAVVSYPHLELDVSRHGGIGSWGCIGVYPCYSAVYRYILLDVDLNSGQAPVMSIVLVGDALLIVVTDDGSQVLVLTYHCRYH